MKDLNGEEFRHDTRQQDISRKSHLRTDGSRQRDSEGISLNSIHAIRPDTKEAEKKLLERAPQAAERLSDAARGLEEVTDYLDLHFVKNNFNDLLNAAHWPKP